MMGSPESQTSLKWNPEAVFLSLRIWDPSLDYPSNTYIKQFVSLRTITNE